MTKASIDTLLLEAVYEGDWQRTASLIEMGAKPTDDLLADACHLGSTPVIRELIRGGANAHALEAASGKCPTLLMLEAIFKRESPATEEDLSTLSALIEIDANLGRPHFGPDGAPMSVIPYLVELQQPALLDKALACGASDRVNDRCPKTAATVLFDAITSNEINEDARIEMIGTLIAHGASVKVKNTLGQTPAELARQAGHAALAEELTRMAEFSSAEFQATKNTDQPAGRKPVILIVGMLEKQFSRLQSSYAKRARLELITSEVLDPTRLRAQSRSADEIIVMSSFVSHSHCKLVHSTGKRPALIAGGVGAISAKVEEACCNWEARQPGFTRADHFDPSELGERVRKTRNQEISEEIGRGSLRQKSP